MAASDRGHTGQRHELMQDLAVVRTMIGQLETKLLEDDTDHVPKADDQAFRLALQRVGDDRLTCLALDYAVCIKGLTGPMVSRTWKQELAEETEEAHRLLLNRLQQVERLARSPVGRLWLRVQATIGRIVRRPPPAQRIPASGRGGDRDRLL